MAGGGGAGTGFVLISLLAALAAAVTRRDLTLELRIPTALWRPSGYFPPIESPG